MKTEHKVKGKKGRRALTVFLIILLIIILIPLGRYVYLQLSVPNIWELNYANVHINFETGQLEVSRVVIDDEEGYINRILEPEELTDYENYIKGFWRNLHVHRSRYEGVYINLPWIISADERIYWTINVTNKSGKWTSVSGIYAYPKDWTDFIARTNALIGVEHLSDDTEGLPLK